jgi:beta-glucosidase
MDIDKILGGLTLEEKASLCMGADFWSTVAIKRAGLAAIRTADGPHGLRKQPTDGDGNVGINESSPATCFPPASLSSSSFDRDLYRAMGEAIADEAVLQGVDVVLGPAINIKRSPLCGRNFEYVSEDPYLAGEYASAFIQGVQSRGVGTSLKHFAVNSQESLRMNIDAAVDERALREIYLRAFETAVKKASPWTVMASYNRVNGSYACENETLLSKLLREEWGFDGLVMSDWSAISDRISALRAGCDLEMPSSGQKRTDEIVAAVRGGKLPEAALDAAARRVLALVDRAQNGTKQKREDAYEKNDALARRIATESMVLLRNEGGALPLDPRGRYALLGAFADRPRFQGGGSSHITPYRITSLKDALARRGVGFEYRPGYRVEGSEPDEALVAEAAAAAARAEAAIVCVGLTDMDEYESLDRKGLSIPRSHLRLVERVAEANENVIVVLCAGSAVEMGWEGRCRAVLYAGVTGQAGGDAIADILLGAANPGGKLTETFPLGLSDTPCASSFPGGSGSVHYRESIYVGYRYYATAGVPVRYPFGHGLSYTRFDYSDFRADSPSLSEGQGLRLSLKVRNSGARDGAEVVQVYVRNAAGKAFAPALELKGFARVKLAAGEEKDIGFTLGYEAFARYEPGSGWVADSGDYEVFAASSSADLRASLRVRVEGRGKQQPREGLEAYWKPSAGGFDEAGFERLYGKPLPQLDRSWRPYTLDTPLAFCRRTLPGRVIYAVGRRVLTQGNPGPEGYAARKALIGALGDSPIRNLVIMNVGTNIETGEGIVDLMNGHPVSGIRKILHSMRKKEK